MVKLFVRHQIKNFDHWHRAYKSFAEMRRRYGVLSDEVFCATGDPTDVTIVHDFRTVEEAQAIIGAAEIHAALAEAGVVGAPTIWIALPV